MTHSQQFAVRLFAAGMMGLGILALIYGDFALVWQPVAPWVPARTALAYLSGILMLLCGAGLLFSATAVWSARLLFLYSILWALLKVPALFVAPQMEAVWLGLGELTVLLSGAWVLFARLSPMNSNSPLAFLWGATGVRLARILFAVSLLPIGLSHLVYLKQTVDFVPTWLPFRPVWAYLTGIGQIACGLGVLASVYPRLAANVEVGMLSIFALLVWAPAIVRSPRRPTPVDCLLHYLGNRGCRLASCLHVVKQARLSSLTSQTEEHLNRSRRLVFTQKQK